MPTENTGESPANDLCTGILSNAKAPPSGDAHRDMSKTRKLLAGSDAMKTLIVLVSGSLFAFLVAANIGLFRTIEAWERNSGLSRYHAGELAALLMGLGIAIATFISRRYGEIRGVPPGEATPNDAIRAAGPWTASRYEQLENLFRQVETAKREWQLSLDSIRDMVILTEPDGTIQRCNRAFRDFTGLSYEEILRENIASLLARFGIEMNGLNLKELNARFHISGKWFGVRSYPCTDFETGNITRIVVIMLDVSAKKVAEEKVWFVWGKRGYARPDGGKEPPPHPKSQGDQAGIGDTPTPSETPPEAIH